MDAIPMGEAAANPDASSNFWAVVPAGGSGTRLWPLSRAAKPKFLLPLLGDRSLLQQTVDRLAPLVPAERTLVVCGAGHAAAVARQLHELPEDNIVVEPSPKGTGPAIGLAAAIIRRQDPQAVMGSFAADHAVRNEDAFRVAVNLAVDAARDGALVTIGIHPTRPATGFGYIERTDEVAASWGESAAYRTVRFVEKPDLERATEFLATGRFLWNASMFIWRVDALFAELQRLQPQLYESLDRIGEAWGTPEQDRVVDEIWASIKESTIDQGVMERAERVVVVPADLGWSDVGDWQNLSELIAQDALGNYVRGDLHLVDTERTTVWSETSRVVGIVGVQDIIVVETEDALLVAHRSRAQDVRRLVDRLKEAQRFEVT